MTSRGNDRGLPGRSSLSRGYHETILSLSSASSESRIGNLIPFRPSEEISADDIYQCRVPLNRRCDELLNRAKKLEDEEEAGSK